MTFSSNLWGKIEITLILKTHSNAVKMTKALFARQDEAGTDHALIRASQSASGLGPVAKLLLLLSSSYLYGRCNLTYVLTWKTLMLNLSYEFQILEEVKVFGGALSFGAVAI